MASFSRSECIPRGVQSTDDTTTQMRLMFIWCEFAAHLVHVLPRSQKQRGLMVGIRATLHPRATTHNDFAGFAASVGIAQTGTSKKEKLMILGFETKVKTGTFSTLFSFLHVFFSFWKLFGGRESVKN